VLSDHIYNLLTHADDADTQAPRTLTRAPPPVRPHNILNLLAVFLVPFFPPFGQALCTGENARGFHYADTPIHHVVKGAAIVGGDVEVRRGGRLPRNERAEARKRHD